MQALAGEVLLAAWERGTPEHDQHRPLTMLSLALPERDEAELAELPLAEVNMLLLAVHELSFGTQIEIFGTCAHCDAPFELAVPAAELAAFQRDRLAGGPCVWREGGRKYRLRPVTTADLLASLRARDVSEAREQLLSRCLGGEPPLSSSVIERFERLNAGAELTLMLSCPGCGRADPIDLDLGRFLWAEVHHAASTLLAEIDTLATAYGWSEQAITAMSSRRRSAYLELVAV